MNRRVGRGVALSREGEGTRSGSERVELERGLGWLSAGALLAGTVIGTGIFLVPSTIAREIGSVHGALLVWVFGGLLSLAGAFCYAELGAAFPEAGGEYVYLRRAYGPLWGFLFGWQQIVIGKTGSIASIATAFAMFLSFFVGELQQPFSALPIGTGIVQVNGIQLVAWSVVLALTVLNYLGVVVGGRVQTVLTLLKVGAILTLALLVFDSGKGSWRHFAAGAPVVGFGGFSAALAAVLWAYDGWNNLTMVAGEIRSPQRVIPKVLILGLAVVMAVYLLANLAYFYALPIEALQHSDRVAQDVAEVVFGDAGAAVITIAALVSTLAALNGAILSGGRVYYAMARDGLFFRHMADLNPAHRTPGKALLLQALLACVLILIFGRDRLAFEHLFNYSIFGIWGFYGITALAVLVLRRRHPELDRPYRAFGYPWIPFVFLVVSAAFCLNMLIGRPAETTLGLAFLLAGLPFYAFWRAAGAGSPATRR